VRPLLFKWSLLSADHIKRIMRIKPSDSQLYMASLLDLLRRYQRRAVIPAFTDFVAEVRAACTIKGQDGPLTQRMALLDSLVAESASNVDLAGVGADLSDVCTPGALVVVDLTDPLLARDECNGIFQVRAARSGAGASVCVMLLCVLKCAPARRGLTHTALPRPRRRRC